LAGVGPSTRYRVAFPTVRGSAVAARWRRRIIALAEAERTRWPLWLPVMFGTGIGTYFALPVEPVSATLLVALGVALCAVALAAASAKATSRAVLALVAAFALGFAIAKLREERVAAPVLSRALGPFSLEGRVEYAQTHGNGVRVVLSALQARRFDVMPAPERVRVSFRYGAERLRPGDRIRATAVLMPPPGPAAPGAYDFARTAFFQRLGAVGYAYGRPNLLARPPSSFLQQSIENTINRLRFRMTLRIHEVLPGSTGSIASALITGDRGGISDPDEQALRDAGLAHVLAIAGLHMALVGLGLFWLVRAVLATMPALALRYPIKKWAAGSALIGSGFYLVISGAGPPSIRAFTMLAMMLLAVLFDRTVLSMRSVALAATIILALEPESLVEPGFQMSFAAVAGLIAVAEWERARAAERERQGRPMFAGIRRYMRGIATTSLVGSIATVPYAIYHFDRATHFAVLGNLLAMPIMGFVTMPAAAIAVALMPLGLDAWPLRVMGVGIQAMLAVGHWVSGLPGAVSVAPAWPVGALVLISLGGLWCVIWRQNWRWLGLVPAAAGVVLAYSLKGPDLLVARDGETAALRVASGSLAFPRYPRDRYAATEWLKRDGDERSPTQAIAKRSDGIRCDSDGCIAHGPAARIIAFPSRVDALAEDCLNADILVSAIAINRPCPRPTFALQKSQVEAAGGYAVWLSPFRVETVQAMRGERPWSRASDVEQLPD
jgi:competence protein ComEC